MRLSWSRSRDLPIELEGCRVGETVPSLPFPRLTSTEVTALRVRALQGDPLREVRDGTREWVLRSLLIGKHLDEWSQMAGISEPRELERALEQVRRWYQQRLTTYHATRH